MNGKALFIHFTLMALIHLLIFMIFISFLVQRHQHLWLVIDDVDDQPIRVATEDELNLLILQKKLTIVMVSYYRCKEPAKSRKDPGQMWIPVHDEIYISDFNCKFPKISDSSTGINILYSYYNCNCN